jgi:23S rRNA (guanosine2251-2'-O)-methyltransferase
MVVPEGFDHDPHYRSSGPVEPHFAGLPEEARPALPRTPIHVVLDNIRSAYNVGSMFRTGDACAVEHIHLCGMSAHPPHPKLEKTALGAHAYVPWTYYERTTKALDGLRAGGVAVVAVEVTTEAVAHTAFDWPKPVAVVFGNEVTGINERVLRRCDAAVNIPMMGYKNSINVATAFGIILYEILRRWGVWAR